MLEISYNQNMEESVRQLIVREAKNRGRSLAELSKAAGKNHAYLQQFVKRGTPADLPERVRRVVATLLEVDEALLRESGTAPPSPSYRPSPQILGDADLKVFAAVEGGPGEMVVSTDPIELVPRPWYMREVRDGFAVLIVGDSMIPAFEPGQLAIVNPRLPPKRNDDVILVSGEEQGEFRASIKRLVNWDAKSWRLKQFNPAKEFTWSKRDWPKALCVVGKYRGG